MTQAPLSRRLLAETVGTAMLVTVVVGSGIAAQQLSPGQTGLQLLENSTATVLGLTVLILLFGPVSGAHFNPVISILDWALGRRTSSGLPGSDLPVYVCGQAVGAVAGSLLGNAMFDLDVVQVSGTDRLSSGHLLGEVVATAGLVALVFALARTARSQVAPAAVGAYIGAAYWFTSSTSFANPAVTLGRIFSDTFAGIAPTSAAAFTLAQAVGALVGAGLVLALYPGAGTRADDALTPHAHLQENLR